MAIRPLEEIRERTGSTRVPFVVSSTAGTCPVEGCGGTLLTTSESDGSAEVRCLARPHDPDEIRDALGLDPADAEPADETGALTIRDAADAPGGVRSSWTPLDLGPVLSGEYELERPEILVRQDGAALLYAGKTHALYGESESGKSWAALVAAAEILRRDSGRVLFLDFESDAGTVVSRLLALEADAGTLRARFAYVRPDGDPTKSETERPAWGALLAESWALVVLDGVTAALDSYGLDGRHEGDVSTFYRQTLDPLARTGAAVVTVDHVTKSNDARGRFALGSQHKMSALTGAGYLVEPLDRLAPGHVGRLALRVAKDRPGAVRASAGTYRASDRTQEAAVLVLDSREKDRTRVTLDGPRGLDEDGEPRAFRPTALMERVSRYLETAGASSTSAVRRGVSGRTEHIIRALETLEAEEYVSAEDGPRGARVFRSARPYRDEEDPRNTDPREGTRPLRRPGPVPTAPEQVRMTPERVPREGSKGLR